MAMDLCAKETLSSRTLVGTLECWRKDDYR
jgi:hypothetical protein